MNPALTAIITILVICGIAVVCQRVASARDRCKHPPPGELIDISGHRLHLRCEGAGNVTVVFDSGAGGCSLDWSWVQPAVAQFARTIVYDRAGYGWSDRGPLPRDADRCVEELHTLLLRAGIAGSYVLVGHSIGGLHMQLYAGRYPEAIAGLVLVDSAERMSFAEQLDSLSTNQDRRLVQKYLQPKSSPVGYWITRNLIAPLGLFRLLGLTPLREAMMPPRDALRPNIRETYRALTHRTSFLQTVLDEGAMLSASAAQVRNEARSLGDLPLIVLIGAQLGGWYMRTGWPERVQSIWPTRRDGLMALARLSTRGKHIIAERSAHNIHMDQPELVVAAIREVIDMAKLK